MSTGGRLAGQFSPVASSAVPIPVVPGPDAATALPPFGALYEEHFDFVWRTARRLGVPHVEADDVVQDAFLVLHRRLAEYDGVTPLKRWLLGIVVRVVSEHRRRFRRKDAPCVPHAADSDGNELLASDAPPPSAEVEQSEALALLDRLLAELDKDKREVLVLAELEEMTAPEIAEVLGVNVNTIYARLRAARKEFEAAHARHRARTSRVENDRRPR